MTMQNLDGKLSQKDKIAHHAHTSRQQNDHLSAEKRRLRTLTTQRPTMFVKNGRLMLQKTNDGGKN